MSEKKCFVITPIGPNDSAIRKRSDQVYKYIIVPCVEKFGYKQENIIRADKISKPGAITHQIIDHVINADLVVADLTEQNPNVFYELAIRHAIRKPYVQICDINTELPFDIQNQRTIYFDYKDLDSVEEAKNNLIASIDAIEKNPERLMTPIHEGLAVENLLQSETSSDQILGQFYNLLINLNDKIEELEKRISKNPEPNNNNDSWIYDYIPAIINDNAFGTIVLDNHKARKKIRIENKKKKE
ncbi:hypothetical protein ABE402_05840 [Bacillus smithii]|uniref:hypothetical protein n=1 Tax=Bacillus smithii TaxID=1479 RepID=UPI003D1CACEA